jgi:hypothetical protein
MLFRPISKIISSNWHNLLVGSMVIQLRKCAPPTMPASQHLTYNSLVNKILTVATTIMTQSTTYSMLGISL